MKESINLKDYGPNPFTVNIEKATINNSNYRTALWTGKYLQMTLMSINPGEDIGLEIHPDTDQFLRLEKGKGYVVMGDSKNKLDYKMEVKSDYAFFIPAGKWHNFVNTGRKAAKLYSIYAPSHHPLGTVHKTKHDAELAELAEEKAKAKKTTKTTTAKKIAKTTKKPVPKIQKQARNKINK